MRIMSLKGVVKRTGNKYKLVKSTYDIDSAWQYIRIQRIDCKHLTDEAFKDLYRVVTRARVPQGDVWVDVVTDKIIEV